MYTKPILVFYHCAISGGPRNIQPDYSLEIVTEQLLLLQTTKLLDAATYVQINVNGTKPDVIAVASILPPNAKIMYIWHGDRAVTEIPTLKLLRERALTTDSYILYFHSKGVSTPGKQINWRRRMELYLIKNSWAECVLFLTKGYDTVGCHWLTPEQFPAQIKTPFYGGNFWWARSSYIATLPELPPDKWNNRYEAEHWIGLNNPTALDLCPGWPTAD